ncbi:SDR family NAD(P)-dependent oxidoreductase [Paenibacillus daejeonensis]|uniref:SDR family NAD(P)-dependent oxidoreductase n=1 Tax=Paenibacillus daejeonensis TaxID=135193 RepID=UPI00036A6E17|nr:SDR family oxidoreductase [Paenibacillus daejeonensis]
MLLENKRAVVTGGARGIGLAIASRFLMEGAEVILCDIHEERLQEALEQLQPLGHVQGKKLDVSDRQAVDNLARELEAAYGGKPADILVNNAGIGASTPFLELTDAIWDSVMNVNLKGAVYCTQALLPGMLSHGGGVILNMGSTNGMRGQPTMAHYNASKAALVSLTQTLAVEFATQGIRANCVCPGSIATELNMKDSGWDPDYLEQFRQHIPQQRFGKPEDIGWACAYLASDVSGFVTGQTLVLDGGLLAQQ